MKVESKTNQNLENVPNLEKKPKQRRKEITIVLHQTYSPGIEEAEGQIYESLPWRL